MAARIWEQSMIPNELPGEVRKADENPHHD